MTTKEENLAWKYSEKKHEDAFFSNDSHQLVSSALNIQNTDLDKMHKLY